ncbi:MAG: methyltransferase domain-containing protein [Chlamydiia bacterium]|nr:methyltransferase domain-containing protein [Chlamydiia bacterium]
MKEETYNFWSKLSPTLDHMTLRTNTKQFDQQEQKEIMSYLPDLSGHHVLELASGIGRFTGHLAHQASHVTSVDFAPQLIETNRMTHKHHTNITYKVADVMDLSFESASFDTVFINWLFIYLSDQNTQLLFERIHNWLKPGGTFFFRESTHATGRSNFGKYTAIYRRIEEYIDLISKYFTLKNHDIVLTYFLQCKLTNQHYWLCQKD